MKFVTLSVFFTLFLSVSAYSQTTGSLSGKVVDGENKPIMGAIVKVLEKAGLGAETDESGEFIILNVEVGTYSVEISYVGLASKKVTDVKVSVDQKKDLGTIQLVSKEFTTEDIVISSSRSGILEIEQSGKVIGTEQIENSGIRGINNIVAKTAGVVQDERGGQINIRGGRTSENLIIVDGVATTNPVDGTSNASVSNSLLQEISVLTGGFGAEYGNALSGVINVTTKSGTDIYSGTLEAQSDVLAGDWIKTTKQGYNLYSFSFGGPLIPSKGVSKVLNFYGSVERQFLGVANPSWIANNLFSNGLIPGFQKSVWSYSGRLNVNLTELKKSVPITFRFGASITNTDQNRVLMSFSKLNAFRNPLEKIEDNLFYGRISHTVSNKFFYELQANYYKSKDVLADPFFQDEWFKYGDTNYVPGLGGNGPGQGQQLQSDPSTENVFRRAWTVYNNYDKKELNYIGAKLDATFALITKKAGDHEFKFGGEYRYHTLRKANFAPVAVAFNPIDSATGQPTFAPQNLWFGRDVLLNSYGYDIRDQYGNQIVSAEDIEAKHPVVAAAYLRDKIDFGDFTVNAGVRMDYLDVATDVLKDPKDLLGADGELLTADDYKKSEANITFSPRLGFSFPVTDRTVFTAQFGKFIQMPPLDYLYVNKLAFKYFFTNSVQNVAENSALKPERLTSYEVGIKQQVGDYVNLGVSAYYKETVDQIGAYRISGSATVPSGYALYYNSDFSVSRGLDFNLSMRRLNRLAADISYTLLYASGIGSDPNSKFTLANNPNGELPNVIFPLDFDQRHTGSLNLDYRFGGESDVPKGFAGKILQNLGLNVLFSFNSGRPYTVRDLPKTAFADDGDATSTKNGVYRSWNIKLDARLDKTVQIWKTNWNFYVYCTNLLNTEIINNVFGATGLPGDNGYLNTATGNASNENYKSNWRDRIRNISNWGAPRQVQFGVKVNF
ncbi:MAG: TonB-dependent receptor [Bacteroidetes bacterium]|nr:TonB-dependent receptor [Bacteroidota bacterium]